MKFGYIFKFLLYAFLNIALFAIFGPKDPSEPWTKIIFPMIATVGLSFIFYYQNIDDLIHYRGLWEQAKKVYYESLGRYRGTLNSDHGLPKGWVIMYENSRDQHKYMETGIKGDDELSFIVNFFESGYLQIEGTSDAPVFTFCPEISIEETLKEEEKIKIKVYRNHVAIFRLRFDD